MKIRLELRRFLSDNRVVPAILIAASLAASLISYELVIPVLFLFLLYYLHQKKLCWEQTSCRISMIERKKIDNDTSIILIGYNNKNFLILSNKNYALRLTEEDNDVRSV